MKRILIVALLASTSAFAQEAQAPKVGGKRLVQVKPPSPQDCKLVGTVRGTKLWAGDCIPIDWKNPVTGTAAKPATYPSVDRPLHEKPMQPE